MIDPRWGNDLNVPDMIREVVERLDDFAEDGPEQVLYISKVWPIIYHRNLGDLMDTDPVALGQAVEKFDEGLI